MLAGNRLTSLPIELSKCKNLGLLRISANQLSELPEWLLEMPKLSWLAFSGNPFVKSPTIRSMELISWKDLQLDQVLGQGASGVIYQALRTTGDSSESVALKIFKGEVTSDGLPQDEMNTCITAGLHPGLVKLIGQIIDHPQGKKGLLMALIPPSFRNLGNPPSFDSCTRDVFPENLKLSTAQAIKIAQTIAAVAEQLHSKNIMHGDLYAHNTLIDEEGNTLFGDFGAATFYENPLIEKLEVSAFGYLLADLISLCETNDQDSLLEKLRELQKNCHQELPSSRPTFKAILQQLS